MALCNWRQAGRTERQVAFPTEISLHFALRDVTRWVQTQENVLIVKVIYFQIKTYTEQRIMAVSPNGLETIHRLSQTSAKESFHRGYFYTILHNSMLCHKTMTLNII
jgi:hypothetical protein